MDENKRHQELKLNIKRTAEKQTKGLIGLINEHNLPPAVEAQMMNLCIYIDGLSNAYITMADHVEAMVSLNKQYIDYFEQLRQVLKEVGLDPDAFPPLRKRE